MYEHDRSRKYCISVWEYDKIISLINIIPTIKYRYFFIKQILQQYKMCVSGLRDLS